MTRVNAANGDACPMGPARALSEEAAFRSAEGSARRPSEAVERSVMRSNRRGVYSLISHAFREKSGSHFFVSRAHPRPAGAAVHRQVVPSAVFTCLAIAIFGVLALTLQHLRFERDSALSASAREVDMRATLLEIGRAHV